MPKKNEKEEAAKERLYIANKPTSATTDVRVYPAVDGNSVLIQLISNLPDDLSVENHRTVLPNDIAESLIDALARAIDYYPKKPRQTGSKSKSKTKSS